MRSNRKWVEFESLYLALKFVWILPACLRCISHFNGQWSGRPAEYREHQLSAGRRGAPLAQDDKK